MLWTINFHQSKKVLLFSTIISTIIWIQSLKFCFWQGRFSFAYVDCLIIYPEFQRDIFSGNNQSKATQLFSLNLCSCLLIILFFNNFVEKKSEIFILIVLNGFFFLAQKMMTACQILGIKMQGWLFFLLYECKILVARKVEMTNDQNCMVFFFHCKIWRSNHVICTILTNLCYDFGPHVGRSTQFFFSDTNFF